MSMPSAPPPPPNPYAPMTTDTSALRGATFGQAFQRFWSKYAVFEGRASRSEYWWAYLAMVVPMAVLDVIALSSGSTGLLIVFLLFIFATLIPNLAVGTRRLHDTGKSGWWQLIGIIPLIGAIILIIFLATAEKPEGDRYSI